jgi:hypothetical protein
MFSTLSESYRFVTGHFKQLLRSSCQIAHKKPVTVIVTTTLKYKIDIPVRAMMTYRDSRGTAPLIPNLGTRQISLLINFTLRPLYLLERTTVRTEHETGWNPKLFRTLREQKNILYLSGFKVQFLQAIFTPTTLITTNCIVFSTLSHIIMLTYRKRL